MDRICEYCGGPIPDGRPRSRFCKDWHQVSAWKAANPDKERARQKRWRAKYPEKVSARNAAYYWVDPEKGRERQRANYAKDPDKHRAAVRASEKKYPEKRRARESLRKARKRAATPIDAEAFTLDDIYERDGRVCHICKMKVRREDASMDHLIPLSQPGTSHTLANVALAHRSCNSRKGNRAVGEQLRLVG